ncbi:dihydrodipicolinate synthase family protein [Natrononativus amylolyticus]|uniref:dihydrodipicolinate synthase family protein n=1 Tax=Natrononativus amylolyticus TaxID=2963434 RepID=UPI0020CBFE0D|nr:dihydrodipicolinate synthase family protein [Natrononativus amylolyticus]
MHGTGVPIVTPFDDTGAVDHEALATLTGWVEEAGVDFLVPCGSTGEAPLLTAEERAQVVETVCGATDLPVLAGTGFEGYEPTLAATERAEAAGADAALVLTPSYYNSDDAALGAYYRDVADESPLPVYLYSVPPFTGHALSARTAESLADHENVAGIKDSSGNIAELQRLLRFTADEAFDVIVGSGSVYASALDVGTDGGILALANAVPEQCARVYRLHADGEADAARSLNTALVELNHALTSRYGIPAVKTALKLRDQPGGYPRRPLTPVDGAAADELEALLEAALDA